MCPICKSRKVSRKEIQDWIQTYEYSDKKSLITTVRYLCKECGNVWFK